ncbi:MAG: acyl-CoA dehydrogenase family protein [Balneolales bacterium]
MKVNTTERKDTSLDFNAYIKSYKKRLAEIFADESNLRHISLERGFPPGSFQDIMERKPLSVFIPKDYHGRGGHVPECLSVLEASSYQSLPLSLMVGINGALFLQPLSKYGTEDTKKRVFDRFVNNQALGGLMITEPEYGSDALHMQTSYQDKGSSYRIKGTKHWGGLTGIADYWLLTAREKDENDDLGRDISFFVHDTSRPGLVVEEVFNNLGLYMLPYGKNVIDVEIPKMNKLVPKTTGVKMMLDILHRSRLQFPGMSMGYLRRLLDEAINHCKERIVGGKALIEYDQVKSRISQLQSAFTACSAMCAYSSNKASVANDLARDDVPANAIKSVITDVMQDAAQSLVQLFGAEGYRLDNIAGRSLVDSRSFQIFEGSNDILYHQIADSILKMMRRVKVRNLYNFLNTYELSSKASDYLRNSLNFEVDTSIAQRKMVCLGKALGRIISMELVIDLGENGFRNDLINNCIETLKTEIETCLSNYKYQNVVDVVVDYKEGSSWINHLNLNT